MKCQEANEWMNRYLDHDLSEIETKQLFQHLDSCPDCAETFDMLKRISAGLDSLPDVKPRYSLVDSILPRLDEMDRLDEQAEVKSDTSSTPSVMTPLVAEADLLRRTDKSDANRRARGTQTQRRRLWTRVAGGAAAVVILGFCVYQFQPKEIPNAEPAVQQQRSAASLSEETAGSSDAASHEPSSSSQSKEINGSFVPGIAADHRTASEPGAEQNPDRVSQATPSPQDKGNSGAKGQTSDKGNSDSDPGKVQSAVPPKESARPNSSTGAEDRSFKLDTPKALADSVPSDDTDPNLSGPGDGSSDPESDGTAFIMDAPDSDPSLVPPSTDVSKNSLSMGIQAMNETNVWKSPNGKYVAKLEDGHLNVYLISSDGNLTRIYDDPVNGEWKAGSASWSEEGSIFAYTVNEENGPVESQVDADQAAALIQK
ncbi:hypothetical protein AWM70_11745 [Paenibacillus yonginensis]|uniref:Anti-sigma-W factor RsiW n=1 Tax=Paenibacillus yonginensis TaxID=1462996 RepID=A0A1B1N184_9BACL|nr:anti-sigma factor [Paenibacillus yonginensis]ANS75192.1 hypothetical protein AWM70_11745 [Paenibacillus yonginensis]